MTKVDERMESINECIGNRIYHTRMLLNIKRNELAERIGVSVQQLAKYENGTNRISASRLILIATALGKNCNYFLERDIEIDNIIFPKLANENQFANYIRILKKLSKLTNEKQQQAIYVLVKSLVE